MVALVAVTLVAEGLCSIPFESPQRRSPVDDVRSAKSEDFPMSAVDKAGWIVGDSGGYRIQEIKTILPNEVFEESHTVGGECEILITKYVAHTQG